MNRPLLMPPLTAATRSACLPSPLRSSAPSPLHPLPSSLSSQSPPSVSYPTVLTMLSRIAQSGKHAVRRAAQMQSRALSAQATQAREQSGQRVSQRKHTQPDVRRKDWASRIEGSQ